MTKKILISNKTEIRENRENNMKHMIMIIITQITNKNNEFRHNNSPQIQTWDSITIHSTSQHTKI